jgi:hypothetical protein
MLGSRISYGIFRWGGEAGCKIVCRLLSGRGGLEMMVSVEWKTVLPRAGGLSGRLPCPGLPPGPGGFNVGKKPGKVRGWSMYTTCSVRFLAELGGPKSNAMGIRISNKTTEKWRRADENSPGTERRSFGQARVLPSPISWTGGSFSRIDASTWLITRRMRPLRAENCSPSCSTGLRTSPVAVAKLRSSAA